MKNIVPRLPWLVPALAAVALLAAAIPPGDAAGDFHIRAFGRIPVVYQGRCKPLDTLARNSLMLVSHRQTYTDEKGNSQPAIRWLLEVMTNTLHPDGAAEKLKVFRIENDQVLSLLHLEQRPGLRYSIEEIAPQYEELNKQAQRADALEASRRDLVDNKILELTHQLQLYLSLAHLEAPHIVPPRAVGDEWKPFGAAIREGGRIDTDNPGARAIGNILLTYAQGDQAGFNQAVTDHLAGLAVRMPDSVQNGGMEVFFNHFEPFYQCAVLYVVVLLLACFAWMGWTEVLNRAAFRLLMLTLALHTGALILRMWLQGRPPVTNLYSSAIFIGWGCCVLAVVLERVYRNGIGTFLGASIGFLTQLIAHNLSGDGDTMEMMQAVLDTNFWLATHVTAVTLGYSATFMAGFLGILFILRGVFTRSLDPATFKNLAGMIYGVIAFATLLSFTGTVLGGIWADQSWGRFWGWDPKENGALIIVLWNALILHARWGGMVRPRGVAVLAVAGNIVTSWSWFGVNMLGVGLHSYGFMSAAVFWLTAFIASQLAIIGIGLIPLERWYSLQAAPGAPAAG